MTLRAKGASSLIIHISVISFRVTRNLPALCTPQLALASACAKPTEDSGTDLPAVQGRERGISSPPQIPSHPSLQTRMHASSLKLPLKHSNVSTPPTVLAKNKTLKRITLIALLALGLSCQESLNLEGTVLEVSLVEEFCGQAILKIEDPAYHHLGESANGEENVFYTMLICDDMGIQTEGSFLVKLVAEYEPGDCAVCLGLLAYDGDNRYNVVRIYEEEK